MMASWSDLSVSSMNCSAPPLNMNVQVLASGQPVKRLYLQEMKLQNEKMKSTKVCTIVSTLNVDVEHVMFTFDDLKVNSHHD